MHATRLRTCQHDEVSHSLTWPIRRQYPGIGLNPGGRSSGLTLERITIDDKRGATHTVFFGWTSYGKGHVPSGGHKPITTIEFADTHPSKEDDRHQRRKVLASRTEQ